MLGYPNPTASSNVNFPLQTTRQGNWQRHIHQHLKHNDPDVIVCAQMEDVALLPSRTVLADIPVIVDLYAPRLLENLYELDDGEVSHINSYVPSLDPMLILLHMKHNEITGKP